MSEYSKPKVTIDLDEYNNLIKAKNDFNADKYVTAAKKVVFSFMRHNGDWKRASDDLKREGIVFFIKQSNIAMPSEDDVLISFVNQ
jgi:hypothetical protein